MSFRADPGPVGSGSRSAVSALRFVKGTLRPAKRAAARALERVWRVSFGAAARITRGGTKRWASSGGQRILVVAPHPDDEALGCVGAILLHVRAGDRVCAAIATDGRRSRSTTNDPAEMALHRRREATDAARLMKLERFEWLGLAEGEWRDLDLQHLLKTLIEEIEPDVIYAPSRVDFHPEHFKVAHGLAMALADTGVRRLRNTRVRIYQIQVPLTCVMTNLVADVSAVGSECEAVLHAYASQAGSVQCGYRLKRYSASWHRIVGRAEEFWELSAEAYVALHRESPALWPSVFRGLRPFPLTDPLAYLAGIRERYRLIALTPGSGR
jgi:LmbE family N-acetylglucosaminyl deacetylase